MDDPDQRLIALLREDARAPLATLAKALRVSRGTVQNRIERLQAAGVPLGFTVRTGGGDAGRVRAIATVAIEGGRSGAVLAALRLIPAVRAAHTTNGRWDLVADLETPDLAGFSAALDAIRRVDGIASETNLLLTTLFLTTVRF